MSLLSFPREVGLKRAICNDQQQYRNYITKLNGKANIYTSLYSFRDKDRNAPWKFDTASAIIDRAWWDFGSRISCSPTLLTPRYRHTIPQAFSTIPKDESKRFIDS